MARRGFSALGLAAWLAASGASAQTAETSSEDARIAEALALRVERHDAEALALLTRVWEETHSPRARAQMARAEQALGRWLDAEQHVSEALAAEADPWIAARLASLEEEREHMRAHLGRVEVLGGVPGATVRVDGREGGALPLPEALWANAGTVLLEVRAPGYLTAQRSVVVSAGETSRETVTLVPMRAAPVPGASAPLVVRGVGGDVNPPRSSVRATLGAAALVTGAVLAVGGVAGHVARELSVSSAASNGCGYDPEGHLAGPTDCGDRVATIDLATALAVTGYVAGALLLGTGVVTLVTAPRTTSAGARASVACAPAWGGASCTLRF